MSIALLPSLAATLLAFGVLYGLWPAIRQRKAMIAYWATAIVVHAGWMIVGRGRVGTIGAGLKILAAVWVVTVVLTVLIGAPTLLIRTIAQRTRRALARKPATEVDLHRRSFLKGATVPTVAIASGVAGAIGGLSQFVIKREEVVIRGLPQAFDGFRIGQITDLHVGAFIDPIDVRHVIDALNEEKVDLQVMTGDLLDHASLIEPVFSQLERCTAPLGMLAILGNHEKRRGLESIFAAYRQAESRGVVRLLVDQSTLLRHNGARLRVVGVDYPMSPGGSHAVSRARRDAFMKTSADRAFVNVMPGETVLCLSHHPDFFPVAAERGAQLTLAGHTHGGQVAFFGTPLFSFFHYILGRYKLGDAHLYVSGGTGHWLPLRIGVPAEVTVLTLRAG